MTLYILAADRWTMLPDADRGHMLEDRFGLPQEVLTGRTHRCSLPFGPTSFRREVIPIGGAEAERRDPTHAKRFPPGRRASRYEEVSGCRRCRGGGDLTSFQQCQNRPDGSAGRYGRAASRKQRGYRGRCFRCGYSLPVPFRRTAKGRDWEQDIIIFTNMPMIRPAISRTR